MSKISMNECCFFLMHSNDDFLKWLISKNLSDFFLFSPKTSLTRHSLNSFKLQKAFNLNNHVYSLHFGAFLFRHFPIFFLLFACVCWLDLFYHCVRNVLPYFFPSFKMRRTNRNQDLSAHMFWLWEIACVLRNGDFFPASHHITDQSEQWNIL